MKPDRSSAAWAAFAATLPIYLLTMNRTIGFIDRGELAAAAWTFGIPHATGYPTLMLLAGIVSHLTPLRPVLALNIFAALLVAAGAAVLVLLYDRVLERLDAGSGRTSAHRPLLALGSALITAFTLTWWQQANGFEVYALHTLMMPLVTLLFLRWLDAAADERRKGFWFALVTGLSFTNHGTTVLLAPGLLVAAAMRLGLGRGFWRRIAALVPPFLLGLLPYAWLPFRSAMNPQLNWGDTRTLQGFLHHVSGGDYRGWMFPSVSDYVDQLRYVLWRLPWELSWIGVVVAAVGVLILARRAPAVAVMAVLFMVSGIGFACGYRIMDVETYLLTTVLGLSLLLVSGFSRIGERFGVHAALGASAALLAVNLTLHWRECDESGHRMAEQMVFDQLGPMPANAVYLSTLWDFGQSAGFYFQAVEGYRRDVLVLNPEMLRVRWYLDDLIRRAPNLTARIPEETAALRRMLVHVEAGGAHDGAEVGAIYRRFLAAFVTAAARDRPVFVTSRFVWLPREFHITPYHLAFWLRTDDVYVPETDWRFRYHPWTGRMDAYVAATAWLYGESRVERAQYESYHGRLEQARRTMASATAFDPGFRLDRIGTLPLAGQGMVVESAKFYATLKQALAVQATGP